MNAAPADLSIAAAGRAIRRGELTAVDLVRAQLDRIATRDPAIGAFVHVDAKGALAAAEHADAGLRAGHDRGPLHGISFAVKDMIDVAGWPVRCGSARLKDRIADHDAAAVARLKDAGAIPLGLVATYEYGTVGPDPTGLYPQPRNPWNTGHVTGGSSSGSAAAVAAGMVRVALGTDTGGSLRSPAAFCGAVGLKPEQGAVPMEGTQPLAPSLDVTGPICASVADAIPVWSALTGQPAPAPTGIGGLRIGYARSWAMDDAAHLALLPLMDDAASALSLLGARIELTDLPDYPLVEAVAGRILAAAQAETHRAILEDGGRGLGRMAHESLQWAQPMSDGDMADARAEQSTIGDRIEAHLARYDAVILPTTMAPAAPFAAIGEGHAAWTPMRTIPFNLTGHAAIAVPMGFADGLPMGLQIVGGFGRTVTILQVAAAFEAATGHGVLRPPLPQMSEVAALA